MSEESRAARRAATKAEFPKEVAQQELAQKIAALEATKPMPDQFPDQESHEEALNQWMQTRGKTIALLRSQVSALQPALNTTGKQGQPVRHFLRPLRPDHPIFTRGFVVGQTVSMTTPPKKPKNQS